MKTATRDVTRIGDWDFAWCFHCNGPTAISPLCGTNACSCGCTLDCKCGEWWDSLDGEYYNACRKSYHHPSQSETYRYAQALADSDEAALRPLLSQACALIRHLHWHGFDFEFDVRMMDGVRDQDSWRLKVFGLPKAAREHLSEPPKKVE